MIGTMFKPFFKRFFGIFVCLTVVSMLAIALLIAFGSTIYNLDMTFKEYLKDYGDTDAVVEIEYTNKADLAGLTEVAGVVGVEYRLTADAYLQKEDGRTITTRLFTYKDDGSSLFDRYILDYIIPSEDKINVSVVRKFALNNDFKLGDTFKVGAFGEYLEFYVDEIIETPEAIQVRANNYVWSDNTDFGYVYVRESELNKAFDQLCVLLAHKIETDDAFRAKYDEMVDSMGDAFPDLVRMAAQDGFSVTYTNQLLVKAADGYTQEQLVSSVKDFLAEKGIKVKSAIENHNMFYYLYIERALDQVEVAAFFLPIFFYVVTMIVIGLFVNQIIKTMTPQIGIMTSVGVDKKNIVSIFTTFTLTMALTAGVLGSGLAVLLNRFLTSSMISVYSMPTIPYALRPLIATGAIISLLFISEIATLISCRAIFRITPKDAMISNEAARRRLSPRLERVIERAPMNIKLSLNSIAQNPRRFFVSVFSMFAASVIILLSLFFYASKTELIDQSVVRRLSFDAQVYMTSVASDELVADVKAQPTVTAMLDCYYTYAEAKTADGSRSTYIECLAYDETVKDPLVVIPDEKGDGSISIGRDGLVLPEAVAEELGVTKGDALVINGVSVMVAAISRQYFHPIVYLSKTQMDELGIDYISSFLVDITDEATFLEYMSEKNASLTVFTSSLSKDLHAIFNSIDPMIYILIGFSLLMGFVILTIMSQNALMEQKRQISILRATGFRIFDISNLWTLQSFSQLLLSTLFALPVGVLAAKILFGMCSSPAQTYPLIVSASAVLFTIAFVFGIIVVGHLVSMWTIKKWNLADNTRCRE